VNQVKIWTCSQVHFCSSKKVFIQARGIFTQAKKNVLCFDCLFFEICGFDKNNLLMIEIE